MVTLYIYVQPVIATCLSIAMGREVPGPRFFIAASLVCGGLFVESVAARRRQRRRLAVTG
jgi:drug/metabolite transporter (DMT)-like permease